MVMSKNPYKHKNTTYDPSSEQLHQRASDLFQEAPTCHVSLHPITRTHTHLSWSQVDRKIPLRQENAGSWQPDWIIMANMARTTDEMLENAKSSFKQVHQAGRAWLPVHLGSFIGWDSQMYVPSPCWKTVAISLQHGMNN